MSRNAKAAEDRCWSCTIANSAVGLVIGWIPFAAAVARGQASFIVLSTIWAIGVTVYTIYRLSVLGYLPYAEFVAKRTGLHDRIGPQPESRSPRELQDSGEQERPSRDQ